MSALRCWANLRNNRKKAIGFFCLGRAGCPRPNFGTKAEPVCSISLLILLNKEGCQKGYPVIVRMEPYRGLSLSYILR